MCEITFMIHVIVVPWRRVVYGIHEWHCFYSKQKPRVCTINHKPRHGTTVLYNAIARRALFGHGCIDVSRIVIHHEEVMKSFEFK